MIAIEQTRHADYRETAIGAARMLPPGIELLFSEHRPVRSYPGAEIAVAVWDVAGRATFGTTAIRLGNHALFLEQSPADLRALADELLDAADEIERAS